jgi:hypothetical protein
MTKSHVVISGTGRCGTTFLMELLTRLGLDTGFDAQDIQRRNYYKTARCGLELDLRQGDLPHIVKSPWFCDYAQEVLGRQDIVIEHVFIPMRDLHAAAESRRRIVREHVARLPLLKRIRHAFKPSIVPGGLWHTSSSTAGKQEEVLQGQVYRLMLALSEKMIPVTFLRYPRIVQDCPYLFDKLKPILGGIAYETFLATFKQSVRPEWVHCFNRNDC